MAATSRELWASEAKNDLAPAILPTLMAGVLHAIEIAFARSSGETVGRGDGVAVTESAVSCSAAALACSFEIIMCRVSAACGAPLTFLGNERRSV